MSRVPKSVSRVLVPSLAMGLLAVIALTVWAGDGKVTAEVKAGTTSADLLIGVKIEDLAEGDSWRDLHLEAEFNPADGPKSKLFEPEGTSVDVYELEKNEDGSPKLDEDGNQVKTKVGTLKKKKYDAKTGTVHYVMASGAPIKEGEYEFKIHLGSVADDSDKWAYLTVRCTTNGKVKYQPGDVIGTGVRAGGAHPEVPTTYALFMGPDPEDDEIVCSIGQTIPLAIEVSPRLEGHSFTVHHSLSLADDEVPDDLGVNINSVTDPVPAGWGIVFTGFEGHVTPTGGPTSPVMLTIPQDPSLSGRVFYLVLAVNNTEETHFVTLDGVLKVCIQ